jgi:hypothetical protein
MRREKLQLRYRLPPERGQQLIWRRRKRRRTRSTALARVTSRAADYSVFYWASGITPGASTVRCLQSFPLASPYAATLTSAKGPELAGPRARTRITCADDQMPPLGVGTPRSFRPPAMARNEVAPPA